MSSHSDTFKYIVTHVFFPLKLPDGDDHTILNDYALAEAVASAARLYHHHLSETEAAQWCNVVEMLVNLSATVQLGSLDRLQTVSQLSNMRVGGTRAFLIRAQNSAIIFRKQQNVTIFEAFEVSPKAEAVMASKGKIVCSYPGPAIEIPAAALGHEVFLSELVNFLVCMNDDVLDSTPTSQKAKSTVLETRDTTHPRYITELLTGILRGIGCPADIVRISKRVGDDVVWNHSELPWRRAPLWLLIRVALQTSLQRSTLGHHAYKRFMLFFMCHLAKENICTDLPNDLLQAMSTKIGRRLQKLNSPAPDWLSRTVLQTSTLLQSILAARWGLVQDAQCLSPPWAPLQLNLARDVQLSLLSSGNYLRNSLANHIIDSPDACFHPEHYRRDALDDFLSPDGSLFEKAFHAEPRVALYDVEHAVEEGIDFWVSRVTDNHGACVKLEVLANKYSSSALKTYRGNPELLSIMLLTIIELWVALDKLAIKETPMLTDYSPEVPTSLLEGLLLFRKGNLDRLSQSYQYLSDRHVLSKRGWSVFSPTITEDSFAVRFLRGSPYLQRLKAEIEGKAQSQVHRKVAELKAANARHAELQRAAAATDHEHERGKKKKHKKECPRCRYDKQLQQMKIAVYEWPLPSQQLHAEAVVFELDCPVSFNMWRTATFHLLVDLSSPSNKPKAPYILLAKYEALRSHFVQHPRSRITLASDAKPFILTHYKKTRVPSTEERVCVNNGLKFYGFDSGGGIAISEALGHEDTRKYSTHQLPNGPYRNLQRYVNSTLHMSNEVLANQTDCHKDISIHEFIAFGHLRSGSSLQWLNILRELRGRSLSFHRHETHFLLAQAVSQVGPLADAKWTWHQEIQQLSFCYALLEELQGLLQDVEANWLEVATTDTISFLLRRILATNHDPAVSQKVLELLSVTRTKVLSWVRELFDKLMQAPENEELCGILRDAAAVCRSTFDIDPVTIPKVLHAAKDIEVLLSSAIMVHHYTPSNHSSLPPYSQLLLDRDRRLSLSLERAIKDAIQADFNDQGINLAVGWVWPDYRPGSRWTLLPNPNSRWISCRTAETARQRSQVVHLNLLDGSLLVDGKPLGRLPSEIQNHPLYKLFFGKRVFDVIPSDLPGMDYSAKGRIFDHQLYFSLRGKNLVIRAIALCSSEIVELIPPEILKGDLPAVLVEGYAHWLNLSTSIMEIRPIDSPWQSSPENWRMECTPGRYQMYRGHEVLVDTRSTSWDMVSRLLKPLDTPQNLIVTASSIDSSQPPSLWQLSVTLPRYRLSFFVNEDGDLQSHNIRDMIYDENQSIGTLFGLVNQLVLQPKLKDGIRAEGLVSRCVLIPEGEVSFRKDGHHVRVEIDTHGSVLRRVTYQTYRVDTDLGYLAGNASLANRLFCAYLHALTSGCGPDPLTGRSGTEEALSLLQSSSCWSIMRFSIRDAKLLHSIASICPSRTWYPKHLKLMQKVEWHDLPINSQHHELYLTSKAIKERYERAQLFHDGPSNVLFDNFPHHVEHLLERSAQRVAYLFPSDISGQPCKANLDVRYSSRDLVTGSSGEHCACAAATVVYQRGNLATNSVVLHLLKSWTKTVLSGNAALSFQYDRSWLAPDIPSIWLTAYNILRRNDEKRRFQMLFSLPAMAYASPELIDLVPAFVAFSTDPRFCQENPPHYGTYDLSEGYQPSVSTLRSYVSDCAHPFERSPEGKAPVNRGEKPKKWRKRQLEAYNARRNRDADAIAQQLLRAWRCVEHWQCSLEPDSYNVAKLTSDSQSLFTRCHHNLQLKEHFTRVQQILDSINVKTIPVPRLWYSVNFLSRRAPSCAPWLPTVNQLFARPAPSLPMRKRLPWFVTNTERSSPPGPVPLHQLISTVEANALNPFQRRYISTLRTSADHFGSEIFTGDQVSAKLPTAKTLVAYYAQCNSSYIEALEYLRQYLGPTSESEQALAQSGQWPRITAYSLFRYLASNSTVVPPDDWKRCLMKLTLLALELQRARRLLRLHIVSLHEELWRELENEGCVGWDPAAHPDWLLIQLQGNFLVRRVQAEVANEMITPRSGTNTAMQLNMGEGKSSVIVPIVVAHIADGDQFVRVVVPKALTAQMFHLLADRLGGLVNRRIYFVPFSRSLQVDHQKVAALWDIMSECMKERGILVVQPEHVLSLRLVSVEKQLSQKKDAQLADLLLKLQRWLHSHSRDILDESDEILHVRYQLVYTIGLQQYMEGFPERWTTTEQVLSLVNKHASSLRDRFPLGVEYSPGPPGAFPHLRILNADAGHQLITWIVQDIVNDSLPNFSFGQLSSRIRDAIQTFISSKEVPPTKTQLVQRYSQGTTVWGGLLLLRGLLATGILLYVFRERRWRVDYGLAPTRTMLAVPYRAKDVPAQKAEFGHPDISIILTCLSYYYGGLNEEQLQLTFEILFKQDDPTLDYNLWVRDRPDIPAYLQALIGVNTKSSEQWNNLLFPLFSRNQATIDFYLSSIVFPREAKEFPSKLSCSGWDLAEKKDRLVTGFSGTNDSQYLLPLHIAQRDPDHQRGTNAKVLSYLLQPENSHYMCMNLENGERRTTQEFLQIMVAQKPEIRVLLDVGAQMLDLQNHELAEAWLDIHPSASAAIYFNEDDELTVRSRDGSTQLLLSSPFAQQLDQCVVYLDDAHTRGTDIRFPIGFRGAVTLGPKVTKDRLTQGCMRMRKLGHGHSIMFFAPLEVDRHIRAVSGRDEDPLNVISTMDILRWAIHETCKEIQQRTSHWVQQGMDHTSRYSAWTSFCEDQLTPMALSNKWLQPEAKKLEDLYGPHNTSATDLRAVPDIYQRCVELGVSSLHDVGMDEEQEREVMHEAEREQQVERPPKVVPVDHSLHPDVVAFVKTGIIPTNRSAFRPAFETLDTTSAVTNEAHVWSRCVLATRDFENTVRFSGKLDEYLRPVQWVVSAKQDQTETLVVMSPYEVNQLITYIRSNDKVRLHVYTPRVTRSMRSCDDLTLYSIPSTPTGWTSLPWLMDQLNVFAGQLYLNDYATYIRLCRFLCVYTRDLQGKTSIEVGADGFILPRNRPVCSWSMGYTFQSSPMNSVRTLMSLRRKGMRFAPTHIGELLNGRLLSQGDFDNDDSH